MERAAIRLAVAFCLAAAPGAVHAQQRMQPGLWEIEMTMQGGAVDGQRFASKKCLSAGEVAATVGSAAEIRAAMEQTSDGCTIGDVTAQGDRVSFRQTCGPVEQAAEFFYRGTTMDGRISMSMAGKPSGTIVQQGRLVGPCS